MRRKALLSITLGLAVLMAPARAVAFCRTSTLTGPLPSNSASCAVGGLPLWWRNSCVGYNVQESASKLVSLNDAEAAFALAFAAWENAACSGAGVGPSITGVDLGPVACDEPGFNPSGANNHTLIFHDDDWPYEGSASTLARTTVTFNVETGEILDADIEVNEFTHSIVVNPGPNQFSLVQVLTHETGHLFGIAHTPDSQATMYYQYNAANKGLLDADDVAAVCAVYLPDGTRSAAPPDDAGAWDGAIEFITASACDPTPLGGSGDACDAGAIDAVAPAEESSSSGAGCEVGTASGGHWDWTFFLAIGALSFARRRLAGRATE